MARPKNPDLSAQRRTEILRAAARVFKAKGFHLARTEDICAEAGLSSGTVFRHFASKQELILEIVRTEFAHYHAEVRRLTSKEGLLFLSRITGPELTALMHPSCYELGTDSWLEISRDSKFKEELLKMDQELRATLAAELNRGIAAGWVRPSLNAEGTANLLLAMFSGMIMDAELGAKFDTDATARALGALFRDYLLLSE